MLFRTWGNRKESKAVGFDKRREAAPGFTGRDRLPDRGTGIIRTYNLLYFNASVMLAGSCSRTESPKWTPVYEHA
jgi:hypothetical protein